MTFQTLGLSEKVLSAISALGYEHPTPIQAQSIPHALEGRDILGIAQTGTGKTAAFTLPMLSRLEQGRARARMPRTLILEPTRELAAQVEEAFARYGVNHKLNVVLLIGGVSFQDQERKIMRGADIVIATPGRLLDFAERGKLMLNGIEIMVIDEADRMLDMGFIPDIERICKIVPPTRQTLFFSATMPPEIVRLTRTFLNNPVKVEIERKETTATTISQFVIKSGGSPHDKRETLRHLIANAVDLKNLIIFCNRKRDVVIVHKSLVKHGFAAGALHGDMNQRARMHALEDFRGEKLKILVCSDVAARGLDIPDVSHVINFDVPTHPEDYVHRIGRTGRAGRSGVAITMVSPNDQKSLNIVVKLIKRPIEEMEPAPIVPRDPQEEADERQERQARQARHERQARPAKSGHRERTGSKSGKGSDEDRQPASQHNRRRDRKPKDGMENDAVLAPLSDNISALPDVQSFDTALPRETGDEPQRDRPRRRRGGKGRNGKKRALQGQEPLAMSSHETAFDGAAQPSTAPLHTERAPNKPHAQRQRQHEQAPRRHYREQTERDGVTGERAIERPTPHKQRDGAHKQPHSAQRGQAAQQKSEPHARAHTHKMSAQPQAAKQAEGAETAPGFGGALPSFLARGVKTLEK